MTNTHTTAQSTTTVNTWFVYFVAIQYFTASGVLGFGNQEVPLSIEIHTLADVQFVEALMHEQGYHQAIVMGYCLLRTETVPDRGRS